MGVPERAVAVVKAARVWAPLFRIAKDPKAEQHQAAIEKRGGLEPLRKDYREATDKLADAVVQLEAEIKRNPAPRRPHKPVDWEGVFGFIANAASVANKVLAGQQGVPAHVIDAHAEDVTNSPTE